MQATVQLFIDIYWNFHVFYIGNFFLAGQLLMKYGCACCQARGQRFACDENLSE